MPELDDSTLRLRILVADSNSPDAERLRAGIDALFPAPDSGVEWRVASTLQEAKHALEDFQPNIIFIDPLCPPVLDWLAFIQSVRDSKPGIVFVLYTKQEDLHRSAAQILGDMSDRLLKYYLFPKETSAASFESNIEFNLFRCKVDLHHRGAADSLARACQEATPVFTPDQIRKLKQMQRAFFEQLLLPPLGGTKAVPRTAFVAMPSDRRLRADYILGVEQLLQDKGFIVVLARDRFQTQEKTLQIRLAIEEATVVIANLTLARPNCYYELGYAMALEKICIPVAKQGTKLHFNVRTQDCIFYENGLDLRKSLEKVLSAFGF